MLISHARPGLFISALIGLLLSSSFTHAQNQAASPPSNDVKLNLEYARVGTRSLKLDLYLPPGSSKPLPLVIWIHGGGWRQGNKNLPAVLPLTQLGFALASIDYRLSQEAIFPAQITDCKAAVRWLRAHAGEYGYKADRIGVVGASAGGHLAALLGTTAGDPLLEGDEGTSGVSSSVQAVFNISGPTNFFDPNVLKTPLSQQQNDILTQFFGGPVTTKTELARQASPVLHITPQTCPFYMVYGDLDHLVPVQEGIEFDQALKKAGFPSTLVIIKGGGHCPTSSESFLGAVAFLHRYLDAP